MGYTNDRNRNGIPDDKEGTWFRNPSQIPTNQFGPTGAPRPTGTGATNPTFPTTPTVTTGTTGGRPGGPVTNGGGLDGTGNWGFLGDAAGWVKNLFGGGSGGGGGANGLLAGGALAAAIWQALEADKLKKKGLEYAEGGYDERKSMRETGMNRALNPQAAVPNLRQRFQTMGHNPYRQGARAVPGPAAAPPMPGSLPPVIGPSIPTGRPVFPGGGRPAVPSVPRPQWPGAPRPRYPLIPEDR